MKIKQRLFRSIAEKNIEDRLSLMKQKVSNIEKQEMIKEEYEALIKESKKYYDY